jgi:hypothetical protein
LGCSCEVLILILLFPKLLGILVKIIDPDGVSWPALALKIAAITLLNED